MRSRKAAAARGAATLLLAVLFLLAACRPALLRPVRLDPALEALIPSDTVYLFGANVEQLRQTPVYQKLAQLALPDVDRLAEESGVDPRKDIEEVLACSNGTGMVTMVRGRFNSASLEPKLQARGAPSIAWKGHTLYGTGEAAITFLSPSILAVGSTPILKSMIDAHGESHGVPPALRPLLEAVPERDQMWMVSAGGLPGSRVGVSEGSRLGDIAGMLRGIQAVMLGVDLSKGLNLTARLDCRTADDARHVHDALRGALGMARLSTPDNQPELLRVYDAIQVTQGNSLVEVKGDLPADQVDRVLTLWLKKPL
ncbi:MAG: hypothetical protein ABSF98_11975 [Bryobacteraceae bacterium]|jgi:hypothetical protein